MTLEKLTEKPIVPGEDKEKIRVLVEHEGKIKRAEAKDFYPKDLKEEQERLEREMKGTGKENADLHLGFYVDEDGDVCQAD